MLFSAVEARLLSLARGGGWGLVRGEGFVCVGRHGYVASSRPVAIANRIEARTASRFGVQF
jgi:hypothetical protein